MSLTVTRANGTSDIPFSLQSNSADQRIYVNPAATAAEPERIVMQAYRRPGGAKGTDKYVFISEKILIEDTTGNTIIARVKTEVSIPRSAESGLATFVADQFAFLKSILTAANFTGLFAGVLPPEADYHVDTFNPA
jgi:hypothetical protein